MTLYTRHRVCYIKWSMQELPPNKSYMLPLMWQPLHVFTTLWYSCSVRLDTFSLMWENNSLAEIAVYMPNRVESGLIKSEHGQNKIRNTSLTNEQIWTPFTKIVITQSILSQNCPDFAEKLLRTLPKTRRARPKSAPMASSKKLAKTRLGTHP